jgi:HKD family nuclease
MLKDLLLQYNSRFTLHNTLVNYSKYVRNQLTPNKQINKYLNKTINKQIACEVYDAVQHTSQCSSFHNEKQRQDTSQCIKAHFITHANQRLKICAQSINK